MTLDTDHYLINESEFVPKNHQKKTSYQIRSWDIEKLKVEEIKHELRKENKKNLQTKTYQESTGHEGKESKKVCWQQQQQEFLAAEFKRKTRVGLTTNDKL